MEINIPLFIQYKKGKLDLRINVITLRPIKAIQTTIRKYLNKTD